MAMSKKMRCVVVDDEPIARLGLVNILANYPTVELVGEAFSADGLDKILEEHKPDLVFMDIMLRDENVLDVLSGLQLDTMLIFTTAFAQYALRGYDFQPVDYLMKPIAPEHLDRALQRAYKEFANHAQENEDIYLRINGKYYRIFYRDILFLEGMENYVVIQTTSKKLVCKCTMQWFENNLPRQMFLRVHRSYIVNKEKVDMIDKLNILMADFTIPISRENRWKVYSAIIPDFDPG
jgi:DNA-binding LytR/AlgR family response regulator